ncbi:MAG: hypothetical protein AAGB01_00685 [Cyanobacteria bacterium P01_F01_bin.42]
MNVLVGILILGVYTGGAFKFWSGFKQTTFSQNRLFLTTMWPIFIFNRSYRSNFVRALKG